MKLFDQSETVRGDQSRSQQSAPWEMPVWKAARGKEAVLLYIVLIHVLAVIGLVFYPAPSLTIILICVGLISLGGLGTTVGYHRSLAHRAVKVHPVIEHLLIFWAMFNGSGHPASWVAYHRHHHSFTDMPEDISSPKHGGFWWAHLRWLYQTTPADSQKWCPELSRGTHRMWTYAQTPLLLVSIVCGLALGWQAFFWIGGVRLVYSLHMQCFVNSLTHLNYSGEKDSSKNVWWLGPLQMAGWGENWHRNHHSSIVSAKFGRHWWQVDIGWYFIRLLEVLKLASHVRVANSPGSDPA